MFLDTSTIMKEPAAQVAQQHYHYKLYSGLQHARKLPAFSNATAEFVLTLLLGHRAAGSSIVV